MKEQIKQALNNAAPTPWTRISRETHKGHYAATIVSEGKEIANLGLWAVNGRDNYEVKWNWDLIANAPEWLKWQNERIEQLEKAIQDAIESIHCGNRKLAVMTLSEALGKEE